MVERGGRRPRPAILALPPAAVTHPSQEFLTIQYGATPRSMFHPTTSTAWLTIAFPGSGAPGGSLQLLASQIPPA